MKVKVLIIGSEILNGFVEDKNSHTFAQKLFQHNIKIDEFRTIHDDFKLIVSTIEELIKEPCLLITSGGLGPTDDDLTVEALCEIVKCKPVYDPKAKERALKYFEHKKNQNSEIKPDIFLKQTQIPETALALTNEFGLAPGVWLPEHKILSLPGFPREIESIWPHVEKVLKSLNLPTKKTAILPIWGISESEIFSTINLEKRVKMGVHALPFGSRIFLEGDQKEVSNIENKIYTTYPENITTDPLTEFVDWCIKNKKTLATAESCTGGLIAKKLTDISGVSKAFLGGVVAYDNSVKQNTLGISQAILTKHGAVSEVVAQEMAIAIKQKFSTDFAISTTGIAGPSGSTPEKPVGTVFIGVASPDGCWTGKFELPLGRVRFREAVVSIAFLFVFGKFTKNFEAKSYPYSNFKKSDF